MTNLRTFSAAADEDRSDAVAPALHNAANETIDLEGYLALDDKGRADLAERRVTLALKPADDVTRLDGVLNGLAQITVDFPAFTDGRGYSQCYLLRERLGYSGDVRAVGDVLLDQIPLYERCGFSSYAIANEATIARLEKGEVPKISNHYQPGADKRPTIFERRAQRSNSKPAAPAASAPADAALAQGPAIEFYHF